MQNVFYNWPPGINWNQSFRSEKDVSELCNQVHDGCNRSAECRVSARSVQQFGSLPARVHLSNRSPKLTTGYRVTRPCREADSRSPIDIIINYVNDNWWWVYCCSLLVLIAFIQVLLFKKLNTLNWNNCIGAFVLFFTIYTSEIICICLPYLSEDLRTIFEWYRYM